MNEEALARQLMLEEESVKLGVVRYQKRRDEEVALPPGKKLLKLATESVAEALQRWIDKVEEGTAGRHHSAYPMIKECELVTAAWITARHAINGASRRDLLQTTAVNIGSSIEDHINFKNMAKKEAGLYNVIAQRVSKSANLRYQANVMRHAVRKYEAEKVSWSTQQKMRVGTLLLEIFMDTTGLFEVIRQTTSRNRTVLLLTPTEATREWLETAHARCEILEPMFLPMVVKPQPWNTPYSGGYLTDHRARLVKTHNRAYLDELGSVDMPEVYDAINAIQEVPWRINKAIFVAMRDIWDGGGSLGGLPSRENHPLPPRPHDIDTDDEVLHIWKREACRVHDDNSRLSSKRLAVSQKLWIAERFLEDEAIYFVHELDFRGRVYPKAAYVNPQGDDSGKSLLEFAEGKPLGKVGPFWLAVHLANLFGVDKVSFDERVQFVLDNEEAILNSAREPLDGARFWTTADDPWWRARATSDLAPLTSA